jgi:hypothetical protein
MNPLSYENMSLEDKQYLGGLSQHPGYPILQRLMEDACRQATEAVIRLDPTDNEYDRKLKSLQMTARIMNDFCATLIKSIVMHTQAAKIEEAINNSDQAIEEVVELETPISFGSTRRKSRKGE